MKALVLTNYLMGTCESKSILFVFLLDVLSGPFGAQHLGKKRDFGSLMFF